MQNRSIFPYRRHGSKKRVKHGPNRKARGPQKGLPNSARDLLPLLQPATKALAQVLAGRAGASGQLGHARSMLAQAERLIGERAHNRLTPSEREEFFEQLARLKLTLADAEIEAETQAVEEHEPRPQAAPVARERLKEMALALSVRERPSQPAAEEPASQPDEFHEEPAPHEEPARAPEPPREPPAGAAGRAGRLLLPKASADKAVQALAIGSLARRRNRTMSWADAASAAEGSGPARLPATPGGEAVDPSPPAPAPRSEPARAADAPRHDDEQDDQAEAHGVANGGHGGNGAAADSDAQAKPVRRRRKPKQQGLPEGWVIDEEGFVVPGAS